MKRPLSLDIALIAALTVLLAGCGTQQTGAGLVAVANTHTHAGFDSTVLTADQARALTSDVAPLARLAEVVYRYDIDTPEQRVVDGCDYPPEVSVPGQSGWRRLDQQLIRTLGQRSGTPAAGPLLPCRSGPGLAYDTFVRLDPDGAPLQAVIAFRGTENNRAEWRADWWANLSQLPLGVIDNAQFRSTREEGAKLIGALSAWLPARAPNAACKGRQAPIELTGHSLGGGLAQHLAYASDPCSVLRTVTFNTSPVTGWFYLYWRDGLKTREPAILRVYMDGEILAYVRKVTTRFTFPREQRTDYSMMFSKETSGKHGMRLLATQLGEHALGPERNALAGAGAD